MIAQPISLAEVRALAQAQFGEMINVRPSQNNRSRGVEDPEIRKRILAVVAKLVRP